MKTPMSSNVVVRGFTLAAILLTLGGCAAIRTPANSCEGESCGDKTDTSDGGTGSDSVDSDIAIGTGRDNTDGTGDGECADIELNATPSVPTVIMVVDRSLSMNYGFDGSTRWNTLRSALLDSNTGLIHDLQDSVRFGLAMFTSSPGSWNHSGECPAIASVSPAMDNFASIENAYGSAEPLGGTPTGESINAIVDNLTANPPPATGPTVLILATDGEPNDCAHQSNLSGIGRPAAIAAVQRAYSRGFRTYVIGIDREIAPEHLQDVANAGVGATDLDAPYWVAGDDAGLKDALHQIVGDQLSCEFALHGSVTPGEECNGEVTLNSAPLACNGVDGWELVNDHTIRLQGAACNQLKAGGPIAVHASFPCSSAILW